jgi:hypothetical protein
VHGHRHARRTLCKLRVALNLTAVNGIISVADPGDFGPATIQHSVTTDGENMGSVGFGTLAVGIFVAGSSPKNVVLRNLTFDGQGSGNYSILLQGPANLTVDQCKIEGFLTTGIEIDSTGAENVLVTNTLVDGANVGQNGFGVFKGIAPDVVALDHVTIKGTTAAAVLNQSGLLQLTNSVVTQSDMAFKPIPPQPSAWRTPPLQPTQWAFASMIGRKSGSIPTTFMTVDSHRELRRDHQDERHQQNQRGDSHTRI